ncbi:MAG: hypothetical protein H8K03_16765 [Nitrospira sp.]|nr:hypothetical protein [Nitrospira sp. BO4]
MNSLSRVVLLMTVVVLGLIILVVKQAGSTQWKQRVEPLAYDGHTRQLILDGKNVPAVSPFISAVAINRRYAAVADYTHLYCLELNSGSLKLVAPILGSKGPSIWLPTGLAYDDAHQRFIVANNLGNQVYEGVLDCDETTFSIRATIASQDTITPEGVALSDGGDVLVVASYDGHNIAAFRRTGDGDWKPLWSFALRNAHGVAILGDQVFASSLERREIVRIDLMSGALNKRIGSQGWNPWDHRMLWPTSLVVHHGNLFRSDAHTGFVCSLDPQSLDTQRCFGGNGPLREHLNMPYGIASLGENLIITSTFQSRVLVVRLDTAGGATILTDYVTRTDGWEAVGGLAIQDREFQDARFPSYRRDWSKDGYIQECDLGPPLEGFRCGYGGLHLRKRHVRLPTMDGLVNQCGYYYFVEGLRGKFGTFLFSPQNACVIYLSIEQSGKVGLLPYHNRHGGWLIDHYLVSGDQALSLTEVEMELKTMLTKLQDKRDRDGVLLPDDAATVFCPGWPDRTARNIAFETKLKATLTSSEGQHFVRTYLACTRDICAGTDLQKIAALLSNSEDANMTLESRYLPCFLSGARCL